MDAGTEVAVDLRWTELSAGTLVTGSITVEGSGVLDVIALATPDEHGQWELTAAAVRRLRRFLAAQPAPSWAELLAACDASL